MKEKINFTAACGLYCGVREVLGDTCEGWNSVKGKPFPARDVQYGGLPCSTAAILTTLVENLPGE